MTQNRFKTTSNRLKMVVVSNFQLKVANHPEAKTIISRLLAGDRIKDIARDFSLAPSTIAKFRTRVLRPAAMGQQTPNCKEVGQYCKQSVQLAKQVVPSLVVGTSTADLVARKLGRYERILDRAEKAGELGNWASIDRAETAALQLQAQLRGEVNQVHSQTTVQMVVYTPNVEQDEEVTEVEVIDAAPAVEEIEAAPVPAELPPPVKQARPKKPAKPPSRIKQLQKLSAAERKQAIRLIGQGLDPFAAAPDLPD